jgi:mono/diheme cytochrome c family protein
LLSGMVAQTRSGHGQTYRRQVLSRRLRTLVLAISPLIALLTVSATGIGHADETELTPEYLNNPDNVALGKELFEGQCTGCHGRNAYPGKAPTLKPEKLTPEDVYLRVAYGFQKMPPWEDVFTEEELMAITAYVKSDRFSN